MLPPLPFVGTNIEKAYFLSWKPKIIKNTRDKWHFFACQFPKLASHFPTHFQTLLPFYFPIHTYASDHCLTLFSLLYCLSFFYLQLLITLLVCLK